MYALLIASLMVFVRGFWAKMAFVTHSGGIKGLRELIPEKFQWKSFFEAVLLTGKVRRNGNVAVFHSLIYYGFVILWIATDLVAIHADTPFKIYKGMTYIIISFLSDIAGIAILIGIALAYKRRYIKRPEYLRATKPKSELFMYGMLVALVTVGYALEGLRIFGTGYAPGRGLVVTGGLGLGQHHRVVALFLRNDGNLVQSLVDDSYGEHHGVCGRYSLLKIFSYLFAPAFGPHHPPETGGRLTGHEL